MGIKQSIRELIGRRNLGRIDFIRYPGSRNGWGGPFNGQMCRQRIFLDLLQNLSIKAIVETGTHLGTTTATFAATALPVYTVEKDPRLFAYSQMRFLWQRHRVHVYNRDSRKFLKALSGDLSVPKDNVFFYLDAHWGDDLPLLEELEIVTSGWTRPIVMIDDFQVPDSDYGFDDYGQGKVLNLAYIQPVIVAHNLSVFFPTAKSSDETGRKRGSVVLCEEVTGLEMATRVETLIRHR